jgi:hypothetical protein
MNGRSTSDAERLLARARDALQPGSGLAERVREGVRARALSELSAGSGERASSSPGSPRALLTPGPGSVQLLRPAAGVKRDIGKLVLVGALMGVVGFLLGSRVSQQRTADASASPARPTFALSSSAPPSPVETEPGRAGALADQRAPADGVALAATRAPDGAALPTSSSPSPQPRARSLVKPMRSQRPPVTSRSRAAPSNEHAELTLREILVLLQRADSAREEGRLGDASELLADIDRRAPGELLLEERLMAAVLLACSQGDSPRAARLAMQLGRLNSASIYAGRLAESCIERHGGPPSTR